MISYSDYLKKEEYTIFLFHGVIHENTHSVRNYTRKHIEKDYFSNLLKDLLKHGTPLGMDELIEIKNEKKTLPENAFLITFDDGFENNASIAAPVLESLNIPATFYLTTDFLESNSMSWIDRIELMLEDTDENTLILPWNETSSDISSRESKVSLLDEIRGHVKKDPDISIDEFINHISSECQQPAPTQSTDPLDQKMSWKQAKELSEHKLFIIGGHTHTHPIMSFLPEKELDFEIKKSMELIEMNCGFRPTHYSYPEGQEHCYSQMVIEMLKSYGIQCCPTAIHGHNPATEDLFHMKRIMVT